MSPEERERDLRERMARAVSRLEEKRDEARGVERARLSGKIDGVKFAAEQKIDSRLPEVLRSEVTRLEQEEHSPRDLRADDRRRGLIEGIKLAAAYMQDDERIFGPMVSDR